ncbi:serine/threonine protein kinase [Candidatus Micrarchaeota archaeon]|nr:serine/threonine protein kinase [Candidatus Micrarchaeota archaeon]MBU1682213.1 serine/threonine protein kinase [Candidatus Micrarchaeota archaeon]
MHKPKAGELPVKNKPPVRKKVSEKVLIDRATDSQDTSIGIAADYKPKEPIVESLEATKVGMLDTLHASSPVSYLGDSLVDDEEEVPTSPKLDVSKLRAKHVIKPKPGAISQDEDTVPALEIGVEGTGLEVSALEEEEILKIAEHESDLESNGTIKKIKDLGYQNIHVLGKGGMGIVYTAFDSNLEREVVIKVMLDELKGKEAQARFMQEAKAAARIRHPNIVEIYNYAQFSDGSECYIVMEHLHGKSLEQILGEEGPMNCERARGIFRQICAGLAEAHKNGVLHRDIKPDNIFITTVDGNDHVKIIDFGVAKVQSTKDEFKTQAGGIVGTPEYMAPEQAFGTKGLDARADIYSAGAVMYHAMTGVDPFDTASHSSNASLFRAVLNDIPISPRKRAPAANIPEDFEAVIMRCLAKEPQERFASANDLKNAIDSARGQSGIAPGPISGQSQVGHSAVDYRAHAANGKMHSEKGKTGLNMVGPNPREMLRRKNKRLFWGVTGAIVLGGVSTAGTVVLMDRDQQGTVQVQKGNIREPLVEEPKAPHTNTADSADIAKTAEPKVQEHEIIFKLDTNNVEVLVGNDSICQPTKSRECSTKLLEGNEKVTFTFKKKGYKETTIEVVPNSKQTIKVVMKPIIRGPVKPRIPKITSED